MSRRFPALPCLLLTLLALAAAPLRAETWAPIDDTEKAAMEERIKTLQANGAAQREAAVAKFEQAQLACWKKVLVTACIDEARQAKVAAIDEARKPEAEARALQKELNNRILATREAKRREEAPKRAEDQRQQAERYRAEQAQAAANRASNQQNLSQEMAKGQAQAARDAQERRKRMAEKTAAKNKEAAAAAQRAVQSGNAEDEVKQRVVEREQRVAEKKAEREAKEKRRAEEKAAYEAGLKERAGKP